MSKTVRERKLDSPAARAKLKASGKPYWRAIDVGLHLGYRKGAHGGRWVLRRYLGRETYSVETIATADDHQDADGQAILSFYQAQGKIREIAKRYRTHAAGAATPVVRDAVAAYLQTRPSRDQHLRLARHVLADEIAGKPLASLTESALGAWRDRRPKDLALATVRRITTDLQAALNFSARNRRKDLPADFAAVIRQGLAGHAPVGSGARPAQVLPDADIRRLIGAAWQVDAADGWGGDLARLVLVLAATGARFSQIVRMTVADVQAKRLMVPVSHKGRGTKTTARIAVRVGDDVVAALAPAVSGRAGHEILLTRPHWAGPGRKPVEEPSPWQWATELSRPWGKIRQLVGMPAEIIPYALRHSSIVRGLRAGLPVRLVAALHDTSAAMIERHYSAYIVDAMDELSAMAVVPLTSAPVSHIREAGKG